MKHTKLEPNGEPRGQLFSYTFGIFGNSSQAFPFPQQLFTTHVTIQYVRKDCEQHKHTNPVIIGGNHAIFTGTMPQPVTIAAALNIRMTDPKASIMKPSKLVHSLPLN